MRVYSTTTLFAENKIHDTVGIYIDNEKGKPNEWMILSQSMRYQDAKRMADALNELCVISEEGKNTI